MFTAYVIQNPQGLLYKGVSSNVIKRLEQHNTNIDFPSYTRNKGPWKLVYFEEFKTLKEAKIREKYFKTGAGRQYLKIAVSRDREIGISQGSS